MWGGSVADILALKAIDTSTIVDGLAIAVQSEIDWYFFRSTSTAVADDKLIINPTTGSGQWLKKPAQGGSNYELKTANYAAKTGDRLLLDTTAGTWTLALPATAQAGETIAIATTGSLEANNLLIDSSNKVNGQIINATNSVRISRNFQNFDLVYSSDAGGWIAAPASVSFLAELTYVSNGDENGVFYRLGTSGGTKPWSNPYPSRLGATSTGSLHPNNPNYYSSVGALADRQPSLFYSDYVSAPSVTFDLGSKNRLTLKGLSFRTASDSTSYNPGVLNIFGSNDGVIFTLIKTIYPPSFMALSEWYYDAITGQTTAYRFIRVQNPNYIYLTLGEVELYGSLITDG